MDLANELWDLDFEISNKFNQIHQEFIQNHRIGSIDYTDDKYTYLEKNSSINIKNCHTQLKQNIIELKNFFIKTNLSNIDKDKDKDKEIKQTRSQILNDFSEIEPNNKFLTTLNNIEKKLNSSICFMQDLMNLIKQISKQRESFRVMSILKNKEFYDSELTSKIDGFDPFYQKAKLHSELKDNMISKYINKITKLRKFIKKQEEFIIELKSSLEMYESNNIEKQVQPKNNQIVKFPNKNFRDTKLSTISSKCEGYTISMDDGFGSKISNNKCIKIEKNESSIRKNRNNNNHKKVGSINNINYTLTSTKISNINQRTITEKNNTIITDSKKSKEKTKQFISKDKIINNPINQKSNRKKDDFIGLELADPEYPSINLLTSPLEFTSKNSESKENIEKKKLESGKKFSFKPKKKSRNFDEPDEENPEDFYNNKINSNKKENHTLYINNINNHHYHISGLDDLKTINSNKNTEKDLMIKKGSKYTITKQNLDIEKSIFPSIHKIDKLEFSSKNSTEIFNSLVDEIDLNQDELLVGNIKSNKLVFNKNQKDNFNQHRINTDVYQDYDKASIKSIYNSVNNSINNSIGSINSIERPLNKSMKISEDRGLQKTKINLKFDNEREDSNVNLNDSNHNDNFNNLNIPYRKCNSIEVEDLDKFKKSDKKDKKTYFASNLKKMFEPKQTYIKSSLNKQVLKSKKK